MRICWRGLMLTLVLGGATFATASSASAVTIGQLSTPDIGFVADTYLQTGSSGSSYTVPFAGTVSSWSFQDDATPATGLKLKVARPAGNSSFTTVGESAVEPQTANAINGPYQVSIPVQQGDVIGIYATGGHFFTTTGSAADSFHSANPPADPPPGTTADYGIGFNRHLALSAEVTPAPPAPIGGPTGRRAAAKKRCKKKFPKGARRTRCLKKAKKLPV